MNKTETGIRGERIAEKVLHRQGMRTLERNYRFGHWEIDLVMRERKTGTLVFVEVKARSESATTLPREAVDAAKQRHLRRAAEAYCLEHDETDTLCRFDVVEVWLESKRTQHIENAF